MGVLLNEGIGDTIRVSLTPRPGGDRRECRSTPRASSCSRSGCVGSRWSVTACPGCGRTTSWTFSRSSPKRTQDYIRERCDWKTEHEGVEAMTLAVMGCVVNGPGDRRRPASGLACRAR